MAKFYSSPKDALKDIDSLAVGEVIDVNGRAARVVLVRGSKTIQFLKSHQGPDPLSMAETSGRYYAGSSSKGSIKSPYGE